MASSCLSAEFVEAFVRQENTAQQPLIRTLLSNFDSILKDKLNLNLSNSLISIKDAHNTGDNFGDEERNKKSLYNWIVYTRSLFALSKLGSDLDGKKLAEEFDRTRRRLPMVDFYTDGRDYKYCLLGTWCQLATFDADERSNLVRALRCGKEVPSDLTSLQFFTNYNFSYN